MRVRTVKADRVPSIHQHRNMMIQPTVPKRINTYGSINTRWSSLSSFIKSFRTNLFSFLFFFHSDDTHALILREDHCTVDLDPNMMIQQIAHPKKISTALSTVLPMVLPTTTMDLVDQLAVVVLVSGFKFEKITITNIIDDNFF